MTDFDIDGLIKTLKRYKIHKWKDDTFDDLSIPWEEKDKQLFQTNLKKRLEQLTTEGKQHYFSLRTILSKLHSLEEIINVLLETINLLENILRNNLLTLKETTSSEQGMPPKQQTKVLKPEKPSSQKSTKATYGRLPAGATEMSPEDIRVDGATKEAIQKPQHGLKDDIRHQLQEILGLIGKPDTTGSKASGKSAKVDTTSQDFQADLTYICSWIKGKKLLMDDTDKEIRKMAKLIAKPNPTATKSPTKKKETKKEKDNTESSKAVEVELAAVNGWIEEQKKRWLEAEQELQQMKQFIETNTPQATQKLEKNKSSKNQTNDNKTSPDEFVAELTKARTWFTETLK